MRARGTGLPALYKDPCGGHSSDRAGQDREELHTQPAAGPEYRLQACTQPQTLHQGSLDLVTALPAGGPRWQPLPPSKWGCTAAAAWHSTCTYAQYEQQYQQIESHFHPPRHMCNTQTVRATVQRVGDSSNMHHTCASSNVLSLHVLLLSSTVLVAACCRCCWTLRALMLMIRWVCSNGGVLLPPCCTLLQQQMYSTPDEMGA